ncbi:helicase-like transcription factor [Mytilus edulis]|uniref:helicase-like transcription factor n=1 Tax=Mytilus edulis TaxID=6550 RepID=UPI0039F1483B
MARTKQTCKASTGGSQYSRATFSNTRKAKKKKPKQKKRWMESGASFRMGGSSYMNYGDIRSCEGFMSYGGAGSSSSSPVIDLDEMGYDELDSEVLLGSIRGNIVGIQYYRGSVNNNEMVALEREQQNKYDRNAIKVTNVDSIQVGHIKRELAKPLADIIDRNLARPEGVVPFGATNAYSMPIDISLWGRQENQETVMNKLRLHGFTGYTPTYQESIPSSSMGYLTPKRTFLSPAEVKNELDRLFENLSEGDKTSTSDPAKAIGTTMYTHQKQALSWMIEREKGSHLPPFWEEKNGRYYNSVTIFTTNQRPNSVRGGILADDMGLGKTLEMIALIVTNFKDNKPIAVPVSGHIRKSKHLSILKKQQMVQDVKKSVQPFKKLKMNFTSESSPYKNGPINKTISRKKVLGLCLDSNLPEEEESTDTNSEEESDLEEVTCEGDAACMLKKEDPDFKLDIQESKENSSPCQNTRRPRRQVKRPIRYEEDSGSDEDFGEIKTPSKKVKAKQSGDDKPYHSMIGKGKGIGKKGKGISKCKKISPTDQVILQSQVVVKTKKEVIDLISPAQSPGPTASIPCEKQKPSPTVDESTKQPGSVKEDCILTLLKSVELLHLKEIFDREQITIDVLVEMGHEDLKSIGIEAFGQRHKVIKAAKNFVNTCSESKNIDQNTGCNLKTEPIKSVKVQASITCCDDLPDPAEQPVMILESDPLDDLEVLGSNASSSECGSGTGRTETTGPRSTLIISPLSVLNNWLDQFEDHIHENVHLDIYTYYGASRTKDPKIIGQQDIVLTTYSTVTADAKGKNNPLQKVEWLRIVLDEGHAIRNPNAQQTKAICALKAERKWILTGTPIQNSMKDLWSLVNFLQISPFTDKQWWNRAIERPLNEGNDNALKRVQHLMGAIAMRRTKTMKINDKPIVDLPERNVFIEHVQLSEEERSVYEAMQKEGKIIVSRYFTQGTLLHNYGDVLAILMRLRQMCCHPLLVAKAAAAIQETVGHLEPGQAIPDHLREKLIGKLLLVLGSGSDEECAICLDGLKEPVITHCAHVFCKRCIDTVIQAEKPHPHCPLCRGNVDTDKLLSPSVEELNQQKDTEQLDISASTWKSSAKVDALINALLKLRQEDPTVKSLVVSQFTSLLSLIEIPLGMHGFNFVRLDGTMSLKQRQTAITQFSNSSFGSPTIMLLSLKAGGVGINLIAASRVFLMDPAWNPATEEQCFDRCHRLGQTRNVTITKFVVDDSVEGRMMDLQDKKRKLMQGAFGKKQSAEEKRTNRIQDIKALMDM